MTEGQLRASVVTIAKGWLGCKEANGTHKKIIELYNSHTPLARSYKVKYTDEWCATTVSAVFIKAGLTDIAPTECSCNKMIELHKKLGQWKESDSYVPKAGDIIMYDWQDKGVGDNTGLADHVGIVVSVTGNNIKIIEGNKGEAVAYRNLKINGRYIRGYCLPNYAKKAGKPATTTTKTGGATVMVTLPVLENGNKNAAVKSLQQLLKAKGYEPKGIDGTFGDDTEAAVKKFQKAKKLTQDGVIGKNTWTALLTK